MKSVADALQSIMVTLWVGGLWAVGYLVAPTLFRVLPERALAGMVAGRLFTLMAWVGIGCAAYLIVYRLARHGARALRQPVFWVTLVMLAFVAVGEFGVQPILASLKGQSGTREVMESVLRDRFAAWHGVASVLYLIVSALGLVLALAVGRGR
jgi:hypothetical protein